MIVNHAHVARRQQHIEALLLDSVTVIMVTERMTIPLVNHSYGLVDLIGDKHQVAVHRHHLATLMVTEGARHDAASAIVIHRLE